MVTCDQGVMALGKGHKHFGTEKNEGFIDRTEKNCLYLVI